MIRSHLLCVSLNLVFNEDFTKYLSHIMLFIIILNVYIVFFRCSLYLRIFPLCLVSCPNLDSLSSGSITISSNGLVTKATYDCASGYILIGLSERTCTNDGIWDSTKPRCGKLY